MSDYSAAETPRGKRLPAFAFSVAEVAEITALSRSTIYEAIITGELPAKKRGRRRLILAGDLETFLKGLPSTNPE
ncbi:helix-turn-helix domain-containing protein [Qipengyuania profundimaris]|uniref:helix-turn-helix domain-containing protein n=1 Tax=Qipengyuania profundimaris TaxID=3067652 RepID=UPI003BF5C6B0